MSQRDIGVTVGAKIGSYILLYDDDMIMIWCMIIKFIYIISASHIVALFVQQLC